MNDNVRPTPSREELLRAYGVLLETALKEWERAQTFKNDFDFVAAAEISVTFGTLEGKQYKLTISEPDLC